jgi:hypothetical protein
MSSELLQVKMGKREIGKGGGGFYTLSHRKERYNSKTRNLWENHGNSGSPETLGKTRNSSLLGSAPKKSTL